MIESIFDKSGYVSNWVATQLFPGRAFGNHTAYAWIEGETIIAGTVFHNWEPTAGVIEMTSAAVSPRWLTRTTLRTMFGYVFDDIHCQMAVLRVSPANERMCSIARRFGFNEYRIPRLRGRNEDELVFTLTDDQWLEHAARVV